MLLNEKCLFILKGKALKGLEKFSIPMDKYVQYDIQLIKFQRVKKNKQKNSKKKIHLFFFSWNQKHY